jgi:hypothetical protein
MTKEKVTTPANDVQAADAVYTEGQATTALVAADATTAVTKTIGGGAYITGLLQSIKDDFIKANEGLDMDFVYMGTWLVITKKGTFQEKDDETIKYGDSIDVVIGQGEKRWSLWGLENSPEAGMLIVASKEKDDAIELLSAWLLENPEAQSRYSIADIDLRYMAFVVPVSTLTPDDFPKIYLMSFSPTATISFGKYAMKLYQGGYKGIGVPARLGVNKVVTRIVTSEKKGKSNSWIGIDFDAVGVFTPADYGIIDTE